MPSHGGRSSARPNKRSPMSDQNKARGTHRSVSPPSDSPQRKRPAHFPTVTIGFQSIIIFLTLCTRQRKPLLANDEAAELLLEAWKAANFWRVGRYVIMPDHIHLFCAPNTFPPRTLGKWIEFWRNHVTRAWPTSCRYSDLAARLLGPTIAPIRIVRREMAVRIEQSSTSRLRSQR